MKINLAFLLANIVIAVNAWAYCDNRIIASTPNERYTVNNDGTIIDDKTGLMWMRCSIGQKWQDNTCEGEALSSDWQNALVLAKATSFANASNWRLPNIKELKSIIEDQCYSPAINESIFPNTSSSGYWSSSLSKSIDFSKSTDHNTGISGKLKIRLVREAP